MHTLNQHLEFRAKNTPNECAIHAPKDRLSFEQTFLLVNNIAQILSNLGLKPGQTVATFLPSKHIDWLVTLASQKIGCLTFSIHSAESLNNLEYKWLITNVDSLNHEPKKTIKIENSWFKIKKLTNAQPSLDGLHNSERIILTSGTTGTSKAIHIDRKDLSDRILCAISLRGPHKKSLNLMGLSTLAGYVNACTNLILGYPLYVCDDDFLTLIESESITLINCTPLQLELLSQKIKPKNTSLQQIRVTGGLIPQPVANVFFSKLPNIQLITDYGSSEIGLVSTKCINRTQSTKVVGSPYIGISYEIVDDESQVLSSQKIGKIRVRKDGMPNSYLNDPDNVAFENGWFYPGDTGFITKTGELAVLGRFEEVVNIGGVKLNLNHLDAQVKTINKLNDAAFFTFTEQDAIRLGVAVSSLNADQFNQFQEEIHVFFKGICPISAIINLKKLPRNHMNKISRKQLEKLFLSNKK
jgi:acyl-coenzyme A synthetase/AMP-(fatty) acid ligase